MFWWCHESLKFDILYILFKLIFLILNKYLETNYLFINFLIKDNKLLLISKIHNNLIKKLFKNKYFFS